MSDSTSLIDAATAPSLLSDLNDEEIVMLFMPLIMMEAAIGQLDGRSLRGPREDKITVRTDFFPR